MHSTNEDSNSTQPETESKQEVSIGRKPRRHLALYGVITTLCLFAAALVGGAMTFGSIPATLAYVGGVRILYSPSVVIPPESRTQLEYRGTVSIHNLTGEPVKVLGANSTCTCVSSTDFPVVVGPWKTEYMDVLVHRSSESTVIDQAIEFYTSYAPENRLVVRVFDEGHG